MLRLGSGMVVIVASVVGASASEPPELASWLLNTTGLASCGPGTLDYAVYEGEIGSWYSHADLDCHDDAGDLAETITSAPGHRYYLIVPVAVGDEGAYGP